MNDLEKKLRSVAVAWRRSMLEVGRVLVKCDADADFPASLAFKVLREEYGMPEATARVAMRWAAGDFGEQESAELVVTKIRHSVLSLMPTETVREVSAGEHRIKSRTEGRVVKKSLASMTRDEVSDNIGPSGFLPIGDREAKPSPFRICRASRVEVTEGGECMLVSDRKGESIHMIVPRRLIDKLLETSEAAEA